VLVAAVAPAAASADGAESTAGGSALPIVLGYFTNWSQYRPGACKFFPENIEPLASRLTHIHYAFAKFSTAGDVTAIEWDDCPSGMWAGCQGTKGSTLYERMMAVRTRHPHLRIVLSLGGWTWGSVNTCPIYSAMASSSASMATFVSQSIKFARTFGFDGLSIDWEYPGFVPRGCKPEDTANFKTLMANLRTAIEADAKASKLPALELAAAVPAGLPEIHGEAPLNVVDSVDYLNLMSYDYHGAWENVTGVNTPLVEETAGDGMSITTSLNAYKQAGVPMSKLVLGLATYGRSWDISGASCLAGDAGDAAGGSAACGLFTFAKGGAGAAGSCTRQKGIMAYYEVEALLKASGTVTAYNETLQAPYAYAASGNPWVGYDDAKSIGVKAALARKLGMAGVMAWSMDTDDFNNGYPLMNAMADAVLGSDCPSACSNHGVCAPSNECVCDAGWTGASCDTCTCAGAGGPCSNHGTCHLNKTADMCECACESGWLGPTCDHSNAPSSCADKSTIKPAKGYFAAAVSVTTPDELVGWTVTWDFNDDSKLSTCYGAPTTLAVTQNGTHVSITTTTVETVPAGGTVSFTCGANAATPGAPPKAVYLNGVACA